MRDTRIVFGAGAFAAVDVAVDGDAAGGGDDAAVEGVGAAVEDVVSGEDEEDVVPVVDDVVAAVDEASVAAGLGGVGSVADDVEAVAGFDDDVAGADAESVVTGVDDADVGAAAIVAGRAATGAGVDGCEDATVVVPDFAGALAATVVAVFASAFAPFFVRPFAPLAPFVDGSVDATAIAGAADGIGIAATATAPLETRRMTNRPDPSVPRRCQTPRAESP